MPLTRELDAEPLPGYRLIEPLGRGGFGEVWKCEAPGGFFKAIKFVEGDTSLAPGHAPGHAPATAEWTAIQLVKTIRHPFLLSMERVEVIDGDLLIVMELADKNLSDRFNEHRHAGLPGVPRDELLHYLREAADVLDLLNFQHGLQHLDIKPANLFLVSGHVKVADFGLVRNLAERSVLSGAASPSSLSAISPRYGAPELFEGAISPCSDQYSLAIVFQEMLTGSFPFNGKNSRQLAMEHTAGTPKLDALAPADQLVVARALAKDPKDRFANCRELVDALANSSATPTPARPVERETVVAGDTVNDLPLTATAAVNPALAKFVPDFHFQNCLGCGPSVESWEACTPQGTRKLVNFLYGVAGRDASAEDKAKARLLALQHPALLPVSLRQGGPGCLIVITDHIADNLRSRFQERRAGGAKGLPREQLLDWLQTAAEALDDLAAAHHLQHQGLNPRNLLLVGERLLVGDFGFFPLIWGPAGQLSAQLQGAYAAPELRTNQPALRCDVYSLAVIYQEMLTGVHPLRGRQPASPNLNPLTNAERSVVAKALDVNPDGRFASCTEFLYALDDARPGGRPTPVAGNVPRSAAEQRNKAGLARLVADSSNFVPASEPETWLTTGNGQTTLQCRFIASLPFGGAHSRFDAFRFQWGAKLVRREENGLVLAIDVPPRGWQRLFGVPPCFTIDIQWNIPCPPAVALPEVVVRIGSGTDGRHVEPAAFRQTAPLLLDSLRTHLLGQSERRGQERLLWAHPVEVAFLRQDGQPGAAVACQAKDISLTGMGFYLASATAGAHLTVTLTTPTHPEPVTLTGTCVRVQRCGDSWYEAGVLFQ